MRKLKDPSRELAKRILTEVDFEDRLTGFSLRERTGAEPVMMYSFKEVVSLFNAPHPCVDFEQLENWIRETIGDEELAGQIADAIKKGHSDQDRIYLMKNLMELRLNQCKKLA